MNRRQLGVSGTLHQSWGKLEIGSARRLAEDSEVARIRYGDWLKLGHSVVAVAMEFNVAARVAGQSIRAEEKRGGKGGVVESCRH
jgi:hypothetical protein